MTGLAYYRKAVAALLLGVATWGGTAAVDGIDGAEWFGLLGVLALTLGVERAENETAPTVEAGEVGAGELKTVLIIAAGVVVGLLAWFLLADALD